MIDRMNLCLLFFVLALAACSDSDVESGENVPQQNEQVKKMLDEYNKHIGVFRTMAEGTCEITDYIEKGEGWYSFQLTDGNVFEMRGCTDADRNIPLFSIDEKGYWVYSLDGKVEALTDMDNRPAIALTKAGKNTVTPRVALNAEGRWMVSFDGAKWKLMNNKAYEGIEKKEKENFSLFEKVKLNEQPKMFEMKTRVGNRIVKVLADYKNTTPAWKHFVMKTDQNVLLDFSYAGYQHGEEAPLDGFSWGYKVINIKTEMAKRNKTARQTLIEVLQEHKLHAKDGKNGNNPNARIVIYFPEGDYVLHSDDDNIKDGTIANQTEKDAKGNNRSLPITVTGGNFVIKGDGRDKTRLIMQTPNLPDDNKVLYSSPVMLQIKHNSSVSPLTDVVSDARKGSFCVDVAQPELISVGEWVCLSVVNNDANFVANELQPYKAEAGMTNIIKNGVQVYDYHQVKSKSGRTIHFAEPIMHEVEKKWNWKIMKYKHYENVGVEDLTFVGNCVNDFEHHRSWADDGAYKPIAFNRLVNSWLRRVDFESVSEAFSIYGSANVSVYDVNIKGNRGHSALRSSGSSRVFIGAVDDQSEGLLVNNRSVREQRAGQYHACGVAKQSMGAVIWKVRWGKDANFESHATQPRATLIDYCSGGFHQLRQGGAADQVPNHLADLTIWNMNVERKPEIGTKGQMPANGAYDWWRKDWMFWKILPPTVVGIHGEPVKFVKEEMKLDENNGHIVEPQSLYEAQLKLRLGEVPAWLQQLK